MVVCPWCGTGYTAFQSICDRCGGPITPPRPAGTAAPGREPSFPPPPPRAISDGYRWKLMRSDAWTLAASIIALLGLIFTVLGFVLTVAVVTAFVGLPFLGLGLVFLIGGGFVLYGRYREAAKGLDILRNGQAVRGEVLAADPNYSVTVNGRNPVTIHYRFELAGREFQSTLTTLNPLDPQFQPGQAVCVLYLPDAPQYSSLYPHP
jgi:hypothetical protein